MAGKHRVPRGAQKARTPRVTETSDYVAFLRRAIHGYGRRIGDDPAALVHLRQIEQDLRDAINLGTYLANRGDGQYSQNEQAAILGVSRQAIAKRIKLGEQVYVAVQARKADGAVVRLADIREERARELAAAGVEDRTGSERELGVMLRAVGS